MRDDEAVPGRRSLVAASVLVGVLAGPAGLAACGSASPPSPPAGVDGLVVPTPDPDPADYVTAIDNPWLPYAVGASWTYRTTTPLAAVPTDGEVLVQVAPGPEVAGVATTAVSTTPDGAAGAAGAVGTVDYFAQDRSGNVWWFGREGEWRAGDGGAQAGLAMAASPRRGDGYLRADVLGQGPLLAEVVAADDTTTTIETTTAGVVTRETYEAGTGLTESESEDGVVWELVAYDAP